MEAADHQKSEPEDELPKVLPVLPDDVLVMVLQHLTLKELFAARVVCRRWADLALHPDVWTDRKLPGTGFDGRPGRGLLRAALALAPRARSLCLGESIHPGWSFGSNWSMLDGGGLLAELAAQTRCGVESLDIHIDDRHAEAVTRILENQAKLRRTRKLNFSLERDIGERWKDLLASVCALLEHVTELHFAVGDEDFDLDWMPSLNASGKSTLRTLSCVFSNTTWALFMGRLMDLHAPTLESVSISASCQQGTLPLPPSCWADPLARAARLRTLDCPMLPNMAESLLQCTELQTLNLTFDTDFRRGSAVWRAATDYLRKARGLRTLTLWGWAMNFETDFLLPCEPVMDLVEALTYSSQPTLEVLECRLCLFHQGNLAYADRLAAAVLGHLPALRELYVYPSDGEAILRLMHRLGSLSRTFTLRVLSDNFCIHLWVEEEAARIKACFDRNPGLHLGLTPFGSGPACQQHDCRDLCDNDGPRRKDKDLVVYLHPDGVRCDHSEPNTRYILHTVPAGIAAAQ